MEKSNPCRELNDLVKSNNSDENISNLAECLIQNPEASLDLSEPAPIKIETVWTIVNETRKEVVEFNSEVCLASEWEIPDFPDWSSQKFLWENIDFWVKDKTTQKDQVEVPFALKNEELITDKKIPETPQQSWENITQEVVEVSDKEKSNEPNLEKNETQENIYEVKSGDNLWEIIKNHYNLKSNSEIASKIKEIIDLQTDNKLKNKLIKSKWNLIHVWDKIILN